MEHAIVIVWVSLLKAKSPGHAAMMIRPNARTPAHGYISFAPRKSGDLYGPGKFYDFQHDCKHYKDRGFWIGCIHGLDTDKMMKQFLTDFAQPQTYSVFNECATQVARYLKHGGGDQYASLWSSKVVGCWSPDDVEDYARSIVVGTKSKGSHARKIKGQGTMF